MLEKCSIIESNACQHRFLKHIATHSLSKDKLGTCLRQLYFISQNFPFHIAATISNSFDEEFLRVMADNLYVEAGGSKGVIHTELFRRLLRALGQLDTRLAPEDVWPEVREVERVCATHYRSSNFVEVLGALYSFEELSSPMVQHWHDALKQIPTLAPRDYSFFTIHISIEQKHADDLEALLTNRQFSREEIIQMQNASSAVLTAMEKMWDRFEAFAEITTAEPA